MPRVKPIVSYLIITVLVLWVILGAVTLPNANKWLRSEGCSIKEDVVSFNTSELSPNINQAVPIKYGQNHFNLNVLLIDHAPAVPHEGLRGILYDLGESCGEELKLTPKPPFLMKHENVSKIALIKQSEGCFLADKIIHAELDGANAVVIYQSNYSLSSYRGLGVMPKTVHIPAYYVDTETGLSLIKDISGFYKKYNTTEPGRSELMVRITMLPSSKPILDHWQFALIIVGIMLIISIIAITVLQIHMWRIAKQHQRLRLEHNHSTVLTSDEQRQLAMDESFWRDIIGQSIPPSSRVPTKRKLDQAVVDLLPTRIYDMQEDEKKTSAESIVDYEPTNCVICLDDFSEGDILRRLPCCHEYHRDCIDVWLTKKSSSCPLCLSCVEIPTVPQESHVNNDSELDLAETWQMLSRHQATTIRVHPFAYNTTNPN